MKQLILLTILTFSVCGYAIAQNSENANAKVVVSKDALQVGKTEAKGVQSKPVSTVDETVEPKKTVLARPVIEMTDEYIDHQIAEIKKVIAKNENNPDFNLSGYQKRIKYLEERRPKKD